MASLKRSTKAQLLNLKAEIPWAEGLLIIDCGVCHTWLISSSHNFYLLSVLPVPSSAGWTLLRSASGFVLCYSLQGNTANSPKTPSGVFH